MKLAYNKTKLQRISWWINYITSLRSKEAFRIKNVEYAKISSLNQIGYKVDSWNLKIS